VNRLSQPNQFPSGQTTCQKTVVQNKADFNPGIPNSDLHLYVIWENSGKNSYAASAGLCVLNAGPRFGAVYFNIGSGTYREPKGTNFEFDRVLETTLH
jgi:hypothetical protein